MGLFPIVQSQSQTSTGADMRRPGTRLHGNHSTSKYHELVFVSLLHATAYCLFYEQRKGVGQICVEYGAVSDRADVDRRALIFVLTNKASWKSFDVEV